MADIHRMIHKLKILDQIIFHIDKDQLHCAAAIPDKNSSGAEVQTAKIVNQIKRSDTWKCLAILTLVFIKWLAEKASKYNQAISTIIASSICFVWEVNLTEV